jgi:6-phosphogluconolactonase
MARGWYNKKLEEGIFMERHVLSDPNSVALEVAQSFEAFAEEAIDSRGRFLFVPSGGSTPKLALEAISQLPGMASTWRKTHVFFGDERCVSPDDARSNFRMVKATLLDHVGIPYGNIHRIKGELGPEAARAEYAAQLEEFFDGTPMMDLVHLGLGPDGHVASLFPDGPELASKDAVVWSFPSPGLEPQVARVSLGLSVLNASRNVQFIVTGENKAEVVAKLGHGQYPADRVKAPRLIWFFDQAAARLK